MLFLQVLLQNLLKKTRNANLLVEVDSRIKAESILKMKTKKYDEMQCLPAGETQHFQRSYQEEGVGIGYRKGDSISPRKTGNYKYKKNLH